MNQATKRRKVWVNFYEDESNDGCAFETKTDAAESASTAYRMSQVKFTERLPGDVVLSREDVAELRELVQANLSATRPSGTDGRILALLRGRR